MQTETLGSSITLLAMGLVLGLLTWSSAFAFEEDLVAALTLPYKRIDLFHTYPR